MFRKDSISKNSRDCCRQVATTAIELMALFGVKDSQTEQENLSHFASVFNSKQGEKLLLLVKNQYKDKPSDTMLFMKAILFLMWGSIKDGEKKLSH